MDLVNRPWCLPALAIETASFFEAREKDIVKSATHAQSVGNAHLIFIA